MSKRAPIKEAHVFEQKNLEEDNVSEVYTSADFVQSELKTVGRKRRRAYEHAMKYAGILALIEESGDTINRSCGEIIDEETGVSNMAHLRAQWHEAKFKANRRRTIFFNICKKTNKQKAALQEELQDMKSSKHKSAEEDYLAQQENLDVPGNTEVLCHAHYYDCECEDCE